MSNHINVSWLLSFFMDTLISEIPFTQKEKINLSSNINRILKGKVSLEILNYCSTLILYNICYLYTVSYGNI